MSFVAGLPDAPGLWQDTPSEEEIYPVNAVPAVRVINLCRQYGARAALADVSFTVERGELFALLGPNGVEKQRSLKFLDTLICHEWGY